MKALVLAAALAATSAQAADTWPVAGRQGLVRFVIVPAEQARDEQAYAQQIGLLCAPDSSCFLNFYTNATGVRLAVPLPDAIEHQATAVFRRSLKQGAELFRWSCRMQLATETCF